VAAGDIEVKGPDHGITGAARETGHALGVEGNGLGLDLVLGTQAEGQGPASHLSDQPADQGIVPPADQKPVPGNLAGELGEGLVHLGEAVVVIQVIPVDIQDDAGLGVHVQKRTPVLAGLGHEEGGIADLGVPGDGVQHPAQEHRGHEPRRVHQHGDQRRGGGLAVGAGHRHGLGEFVHDMPQQLGAADNREPRVPGGLDFGIFIAGGQGVDHEIRPGDMIGMVAPLYGDPRPAHALGDGAFGEIAARDGEALGLKPLGQAAHADAPDAHHMGVFIMLPDGMR